MNRRGFLQSMLALGVAPAVVSSGVLMKVKPLLLPGEDFEIGFYNNIRFVESASPVNFVLMKQLLEAARKKLPYFNGELPGHFVKADDRVAVRWERVANLSVGVSMT